ncbi:MAG: efflux RND transporter periplasmic adaptor subunit [Gammaproteobacteria bacterium]|nr:efflux RND transporter periplasmic adaptor subunit [Gammaproteobacteria bacterium]MBU1776470.1 efflux RND transporter periplasmic adaptor subunit [Gammaproteobacteria bacterium]MBU1968887.1 efflux RND transporter periplasmic adaptor subunit [Gammaproteobacteria bacterium]
MSNDSTARRNLLLDIVNTGTAGKRKKIWIVAAAALLLLVWLLYPSSGSSNGMRYITEEIARGDLSVTVSATGNLYPINQVDVGSELSGIVEKVQVDENDRVKRGQVLAQLDLSKLDDQVTKSTAAVLSAEAQVAQTQATMKETAANLARLRRVQELSGGKVPSPTEMDSAEAALSRAEANEASARAAAAQAAATLRSDRTNLSKATIRSPIDGIVLKRQIEPGQTVAASLQAPVLFTLAEDLARMELQVNVDEADVSQVKIGQAANFTVDAWPGRKYPAEIVRVGFGAQTTEGVVTYKTILKVSNRDLSLRPGMTATADIGTASLTDVLLVPNAALRYTPAQSAPAQKSGSFVTNLMPRPPAQPRQAKVIGDGAANSSKKVWILREKQPVAVDIEVGLSNGRYTEVLSGELQAGMTVITGTQKSAK